MALNTKVPEATGTAKSYSLKITKDNHKHSIAPEKRRAGHEKSRGVRREAEFFFKGSINP